MFPIIPIALTAIYAGYKAMCKELDDNGSKVRKHVTKPAKEELSNLVQGMHALGRGTRDSFTEARSKQGAPKGTVNKTTPDSLSD